VIVDAAGANGWSVTTAEQHLSLLDSGNLMLMIQYQKPNTLSRCTTGLIFSSPPTTENSVLPLLSRARKSSASIKIPQYSASSTISSGVAAAVAVAGGLLL